MPGAEGGVSRKQILVMIGGAVATYLLGGGTSFPNCYALFLIVVPIVTMGIVVLLGDGLNGRQKLALVVGLTCIVVVGVLAYAWSFELGSKPGEQKAYCPDLPRLLGPTFAATALTIAAVLALRKSRP